MFDSFDKDDVIMAFFPCTRFEAKIPLSFRGELWQMKRYTLRQKLEYAMKLHEELHRNYMLITKLVLIALDRGLKLIIENPYTAPHYLTTYWCVKPAIIDKDRRDNGDYLKKPTQYFFIGCEPKQNIIFEPLDYVEKRVISQINCKGREIMRSEIHPQYANRFIKQYILDGVDK